MISSFEGSCLFVASLPLQALNSVTPNNMRQVIIFIFFLMVFFFWSKIYLPIIHNIQESSLGKEH